MDNEHLRTASAVLAKAACYDPTLPRPDQAVVLAWAEALGGVDKDDALSVVAKHYASESRRIMPADVLAGVKAIRRERLDRTVEAVPVADPDDVPTYLAEVRQGRRETAGKGNPVGAERVRRMVEPAFRHVGGKS